MSHEFDCQENTTDCALKKIMEWRWCAVVGHLGLFANLSMFSWMTVMCFNLLRTFRRMEPSFINTSSRRFLAYSIFGWGLPFLWTIFTLAASVFTKKGSRYNPMIGHNHCFVDKKPARQLIFFYLPMCFLLLLNLVGFIFCLINLRANRGGELSARRKRAETVLEKITMNRKTRTQIVGFHQSISKHLSFLFYRF